ncbi:MAG: putative porin, partial [Sphingomonadaceae bacterium]
IRADQAARIAQIERETSARIATIEASLDVIEGKPAGTSAAQAQTAVAATSAQPVQVAAAAPTTAPVSAPLSDSRLDISGDVRLRYEENFSDRDARDRGRGVLRARLRASYQALDWLTVGGEISTGDPDDPNSTDISLSNFDDDLSFSLSQAYARATFGNLQLWGGKFGNPFVKTELVWDGDVNPQGASAIYKMPLGTGIEAKATGLYFLIDEAVSGPNSDMVGGQLSLAAQLAPTLKAELAAAYYDYTLHSVGGADSGDFRSNLIGPAGRYLSDFNLFDAIAALTWSGLGERWPVRIAGDYVHNSGAATSADTGYALDLQVGRGSKLHDWKFGYGYSQAETDAVFAAFSQDNTNIATNYRQHALSIDYVAWNNVILNATFYHYRPLHAIDAGPNDPKDWLNRLRLNFLVNF